MSLAALCAFCYWTLGAKRQGPSLRCASASNAATWQTRAAAAMPSCYRCAPMRLQDEWFDVEVNQDSLGEPKGTIVGNLPFSAVPEYPSFPGPCFLFDSNRMLPQCLSSRLAFVVIHWAVLFGLKIHASFGKVKSGNFRDIHCFLCDRENCIFFFFRSAESWLSEVVQEIW